MSRKQTRMQVEAHVEESQPTVMRATRETYVDTGVLPSAKELTEYQALDPRFVDFFLKTAEREQEARIAQNDRIIKVMEQKETKVASDRRLGMILAFVLFLLVLGLVAYALYQGSPWFAGILAALSVGGVVQAFTGAHKTKEP